MDALELAAPSAAVLEMGKDHHLTDPHDVAVEFGDEHLAASGPRLEHGAPVGVARPGVLDLGRERSADQQVDGARDVRFANGTDEDHRFSRAGRSE